MLLTGHPTNQESSITVKLALTTLSFWSVLSVEPGKSRTHGEPDGESQATLDLLEETLAVSVPTLVSILIDSPLNYLSKFFEKIFLYLSFSFYFKT